MNHAILIFASASLLAAVCGTQNCTLKDVQRRTGCSLTRLSDPPRLELIGVRAQDAQNLIEAHVVHVLNPRIASYKPTRFIQTSPEDAAHIIGRGWRRVKDCESLFQCEVRVLKPIATLGTEFAITADSVSSVDSAVSFLMSRTI